MSLQHTEPEQVFLVDRIEHRNSRPLDDLVILCKKGNADQALQQLRKIMSKLKLTVNEEKTRICKVPEGEFDFLGYSVLQRHKERRATRDRKRCRKAA